MEVDEQDKCVDVKEETTCPVEDVKENNGEETNKDDVEKECDKFKKPTLTARIPAKKSTLHKYLQQKKLDNELNSAEQSANSESIVETTNEVEEVETKQIETNKPKLITLPYTEPDWKGLAIAKYQLEVI